MHDLTLISKRNTRGRDHGENMQSDQLLCSIPHCEQQRADRVSIHLCEKHIEKAWAAYQVLQGFVLEDPIAAERDVHSLDAKGTVYVVRIGELIKIGWTSNPKQRMRQLNPDAILHYRPGTRRDEYRLQGLCVEHLAKGREWFTANEAMADFINELRVGKTTA